MDVTRIYAVTSALLIPTNIFCAYWIFRKLLDLSGTTLRKMINDLSDVSIGSGRKGLRHRQKVILRYLSERSQDPKKTQTLFRGYIRGTVLCFLGKILLDGFVFSENPYKDKIALWATIVFIAINAVFVTFGILYRKSCS